jgi:hypothetical protein
MTIINLRRSLAALAALGAAAVTACADAPLAPTGANASLAPTDAARANTTSISTSTSGSGSTSTTVTSGGDTSRVTFSYGPNTSVTVRVGAHKIVLPTNAVCDPSTSGYGPTTWDKPCAALSKSITFQVKAWTDAAGHPRVRFSPDVRFVPTKTVTLYLYDRAAVADPAFRFMWCPTGATTCVDESRTDASLLPKRDATGGYLYGRIKHFSGYNVVVDRAGDGSEPSDDGAGFGF